MDKTTLRTQMLDMRNKLQKEFIQQCASKMQKIIEDMAQFHSAKTVMLYEDFRNEAKTDLIFSACINAGKKVVLPLTDEEFRIHAFYIEDESCLRLSRLGILEPDPPKCLPCLPSEIDFFIIPGVAFDRLGNRLGYGKGCYDRFLADARPNAVRVGLAYDFQVCPNIPKDPQDQPMDALVTEKGLLLTGTRLL